MKSYAFTVLVFCILTAGCVSHRPALNLTTNTTINESERYMDIVFGKVPENWTWKNYTDRWNGFSLQYPSYMEVVNETREAAVFFLAPREDESDYRENINLRVTTFSKKTFTIDIDSYARSLEKVLDKEYYNLKTTESYNTVLNNRSVRIIVFSGRNRATLLNMKFMEFIWAYGNRVYEFTYSALEEDYGQFEDVAEEMAGSLELQADNASVK
jgi:hypothetical protein